MRSLSVSVRMVLHPHCSGSLGFTGFRDILKWLGPNVAPDLQVGQLWCMVCPIELVLYGGPPLFNLAIRIRRGRKHKVTRKHGSEPESPAQN